MYLFSPTNTSSAAQQMRGFRMLFCTDLDCWENQNATVQSEPQVAITSSQAAFEPLLKIPRRKAPGPGCCWTSPWKHSYIRAYQECRNAYLQGFMSKLLNHQTTAWAWACFCYKEAACLNTAQIRVRFNPKAPPKGKNFEDWAFPIPAHGDVRPPRGCRSQS